MDRLASDGNIRQARMVVDAVSRSKPDADPDVMLVMLDSLARVGRRGDFSLGQRISPLKKLMGHPDTEVAAAAVANLGVWQLKGSDPDLFRILRDNKRPDPVRRAAAVSLGQLRGAEIADTLRTLAGEGDPADRYLAVFGLAVADIDDAARAAADLLVLPPGQSDPVALVQAFSSQSIGANALTAALDALKPHPEVVDRLSAYHRRTGQLPRSLERIFSPSTPRSLSKLLIREDRKALTADVIESGDPVRGENVYRRKALACTACHAIGPVGSHIGPNLVAVGAAAQTDYVVDAILEPNKAIAQHYENKLITLANGSVHMGAITYKSDKEVIIRDSAQGGREVKLPMSDVRKMKPMPSLMPAGLADQLKTRQEFLDLAKFVSLLGRPGPYANDESPVIRRGIVSDTPDGAGITAYSLVNGELPTTDLPDSPRAYARGFVNVQVPGPVKLLINDSTGLTLKLDGKSVTDLSAPLQLNSGRRTLTFQIDRARRGTRGLRIELAPAPGSKARFMPEGGI
ncbi:MAG: hypothetical protein HN675_09695 [Opitutae bacterium]|nr:hypothetical protein [Opitutae bacterium]